jgi:hypothetical protein
MTTDYHNFSDAKSNVQDLSLLCEKCSYQLIGMPRDGQCPECHHPVSLSRKSAIAEEAVAGIATQNLAGVCTFILARNVCLFGAFFGSLFGSFFFARSLPGVFLLLAIICEALAGLGLRGVLPIAQTPSLLKKFLLLHYIQNLWGIIVAWPVFLALIIYGLHHRTSTRTNPQPALLLNLAIAASLLLLALTACIIMLYISGQFGSSTLEQLLLQTFVIGTTITSGLLGASAWLVSKPAWDEKLDN